MILDKDFMIPCSDGLNGFYFLKGEDVFKEMIKDLDGVNPDINLDDKIVLCREYIKLKSEQIKKNYCV